jgi:hypothetical protein
MRYNFNCDHVITTIEEVEMDVAELIKLHSKPELAEVEDMVYQVWEDGEITLQKSGSLLWKRGLHMIEAGLGCSVDVDLFPNQTSNGHGYIYTDQEGAEAVRAAMRK